VLGGRVETVRDHGLGTAAFFFGGLEEEDERAGPVGAGFEERFCGGEEGGYVEVVPASSGIV